VRVRDGGYLVAWSVRRHLGVFLRFENSVSVRRKKSLLVRKHSIRLGAVCCEYAYVLKTMLSLLSWGPSRYMYLGGWCS
jgi:hypothetical protein